MRRTYITAIILALLAVLWIASGQLRGKPPLPPDNISEQNRLLETMSGERPPTRVRVDQIYASEQTRYITIRGRTRNKRTVIVRSQISGTLAARPVERGTSVKEGQVLCRISVDDREVAHEEARAIKERAQMEYEGSLRLSKQGLQSEIVIARARSSLATAEAGVSRTALDLSRLNITAPFSGVVEEVQLEAGDYVTPGAPCVTLVDLDPMLLTGRLPENEFSRIRTDTNAIGTVSTGIQVSGPVTFIGNTADEDTRSYDIEIQVPNENHAIPSGVSVRIEVPVESVTAQRISSAILALDDEGQMGVRTIDSNNIVHFNPVDLIADAGTGIWVTGLPDIATVITVGQELVVAGEAVEPVYPTADD